MNSTIMQILIFSTFIASWYFETSEPQRITSELKAMFSLPPIYSAHMSSNHKLSPKHKISLDSNLQKTCTNIKNKFLEKLVPLVLLLLKKHIRLGYVGIMDHSVDLSIPDFKKVYKKRNGQKEKKIVYNNKCIAANTNAIWKHAVHTTDQLTSPSC